jgi:hypothetical protein
MLEKKESDSRRLYPLNLLRGTATTPAHRTTSAARLEVSTGSVAAHTASAARSTAARETSPVELCRILTALFDL